MPTGVDSMLSGDHCTAEIVFKRTLECSQRQIGPSVSTNDSNTYLFKKDGWVQFGTQYRWVGNHINRIKWNYSVTIMDSSATTLVSVGNTLVIWTAVMALTERCTVCRRNTHFLSPRDWDVMQTYLLYVVPRYAPSERHVCYSLCIACSYTFASYTTRGDIYTFFRSWDQLYLSVVAIYRMVHSPPLCLPLRYCHILQ